MSRKVPISLRLIVFAWVAVLSLPYALLPPPPFIECSTPSSPNEHDPKCAQSPAAPPPHLWPLRCSDSAVPPHWFLAYTREFLRPWHLPLIGAVQAAASHAPSFSALGSRRVKRIQSVVLLEWLIYVPAFQMCAIMFFWLAARVYLSVLWTVAGHCALQYMWDGLRHLRKMPASTAESWWLQINLVLFALVEVPMIVFLSGGMLRNTRPLFAVSNLGFFALAHLMGGIIAEVCSDLFATFRLQITRQHGE
jgi:hypothetical protein